MFDLRAATEKQIEDGLGKCSPFRIATPECGIGIFFLAPLAYDKLLSWQLWEEAKAWGEMVVPYVESGHQGPIPLVHIEELISIEVEEDPDSMIAMYRRIQRERGGA